MATVNENLLSAPCSMVRVQLLLIPRSSISSTNLPSVWVYDLYYLNWALILVHSAPDMSTVSASIIRTVHHQPFACQKGVPIITTGSLKSRKNGNPGMPIFTGCVYFHDTGVIKFCFLRRTNFSTEPVSSTFSSNTPSGKFSGRTST